MKNEKHVAQKHLEMAYECTDGEYGDDVNWNKIHGRIAAALSQVEAETTKLYGSRAETIDAAIKASYERGKSEAQKEREVEELKYILEPRAVLESEAYERGRQEALASKVVNGETSDGYHTFNELYEHRVLLFINLCLNYASQCTWKKHYDGWFLLVWQSPTGQISYHCHEKYLDLVRGMIREAEHIWDGHTSQDVIERLNKLTTFWRPQHLDALRDKLTLAPNEPEVKAQEWAEKKASDIVNKFLHKPITDTYLCILKDEIIAVLLDAVDISKKYEKHDQSKTLNEKSDIPRSEVKAQGFEELFNLKIKPLLNSSEAFVTYAPYEWFLEFFKAGQKSQATTLKLPDKKCNRYDETDDLIGTIEVVTHNSLLDKIIRLNPEFKIQVVLDAVKSMNEGE